MVTSGGVHLGGTVMRIVGNISYAGRTVDTDSIFQFGIIMAPDSVDAADIDPGVNTNLDWMYLTHRGFRQPAYDGVDSFENFWIELDLSGRRKFAEGSQLFFALNAVGQNITAFVNLSTLILLA